MSEPIKILCKQVNANHIGKLSDNIRKRITACEEHMNELLEQTTKKGIPFTDKQQKASDHLKRRWAELQISYRLVFNTAWILERRLDFIPRLKQRIPEFAAANDKTTELIEKRKLYELEKSMRCKKCKQHDLGPLGYIGINENTGEFDLCKCTIETIHIIN